MPIPAVKSILFITISIILSIVILSIFTLYFYDTNSFLNIIENKTISILKIKDVKYESKINTNKYVILNFDQNISSRLFVELLYYLKDSDLSYIVLDKNLDFLEDKLSLEEINKIVKENIFLNSLTIENSKGINYSFQNIPYDKSLIEYSRILNTKMSFLFSNFNNTNYKVESGIAFSPQNTGFMMNNRFFDKNNIDLLLKINSNYILSAPYLLYFKLNNWNIDKSKFDYMNLKYRFDTIYYDQKGRASYLHNIKIEKEPISNNFSEWKAAFEARINTIEKLKVINIFKSNSKEYELYKDEKYIIDNVYNYTDLADEKLNEILDSAKNDVAVWKGFKNVNSVTLKNKGLFITENNNKKWINNFIYQFETIQNGENLKRIPLEIILLFTILFLIFFSLITYKIGNKIIPLIITILFLVILLPAYIIIRLALHIDFPFTSSFVTSLYGFILGLLFTVYSKYVWNKEVRIIFKSSVSEKFNSDIANIWKYKNWDFSTSLYLCTFLHVDTSKLIERDINENDIESISVKQSEIESIIKNNYGIRNNFNPAEISAYFGNPPIIHDHAFKAIKTANEISKMQINIAGENVALTQAVHSKEEWFNFMKKKGQKVYTYYGNSTNILYSMIKYAKKFDIDIIISENVYKLSSMIIPVRMLDRVKIPGISGTIRLFELIDEEKYQKNKEFYNYYHAGLKLYENKKWKEAGSYFMQSLKIQKDDKLSQTYLDRCKKAVNLSSKNEWESVYIIE